MYYAVIADNRSLNDVKSCIKTFSLSHRAKWAYPAHSGADHCQTFQEKIIARCNIQIRRMVPGTFEDFVVEEADITYDPD
jgi:hypothetical protein